MKQLIFAMTIGAAALLANTAADAAGHAVMVKAAPDVTQSPTDISSQARRYRHYGYRDYRRNYRSYGYAPRRYYGGGYGGASYGGGYGYGGPSVTFGFGGGGYRGW